MTKRTAILLTTLLTLCVFTLLAYSSCERNKCKNVICQNGGYCAEGSCKCKGNWIGSDCSQLKPDPCKDVTCQNLGTCDGTTGNCNCIIGYEGTHCETQSSTGLIGNYTVTETCSISGSVGPFNAQITQSVSPHIIIMHNFGDFASFFGDFDISTYITAPGTLAIPMQEPHAVTVSGNGSYSNGVLTITYSTVSDTVNNETCTATWVKQ